MLKIVPDLKLVRAPKGQLSLFLGTAMFGLYSTVRIDQETKRKIKKHGINVSQTVRKALEKEISKKEDMKLQRAIEDAGRILRKIPEKEIVKMIRESREER